MEEDSDFTSSLQSKFGWEEYLVFGIVILISTGIGVFYGVVKRKNHTKDEFLMGSRQMSAFPVALSIMCSFISAIGMLGNPMEVYHYGTQFMMNVATFLPVTLALLFIYVPVYFKMQLTSSYEYLELRFNVAVRYLVSAINILYLIMYMALVVYGPSLALNQVTGFDMDISVAVIFVICIFYSSLGGFRAVLMTDALQGMIMIGATLAIIIKGFYDLDFNTIVEHSKETRRWEFFNTDTDPRTRLTLWSVLLGGFFQYLNFFAGTQANIQRYSSMPNMKTVKKAIWLNLLVLTILLSSVYLTGLILIGKYFYCDPHAAGLVGASDQTVPFLVMDILGDFPGLPGVFVAGITCGSLSTVSSGLNALAAVITEDYVRRWRPNLSDSSLLKISRLVSVVSGVLSFGFVFIVRNMGNIYPVSTSLAGMVMGPTTGVFTLGILFPWANGWGAFLGVITTYAFTAVLTVGSSIAGINGQMPDQKLSLSTENCSAYFSRDELESIPHLNHSYAPGFDWKERHEDDSGYIKMLSTSYLLIHAIGVLGCVLMGLIFSFIISTVSGNQKRVREECLNPYLLRLWRKLMPKRMEDMIENEIIVTDKKEKPVTT